MNQQMSERQAADATKRNHEGRERRRIRIVLVLKPVEFEGFGTVQLFLRRPTRGARPCRYRDFGHYRAGPGRAMIGG